ncbi:MAG TPA: arsenate reductase ArsC [Parvularculaceae bacterium]|nr:arsenate reductase ArsC [Parvularculaceae bacterium]
MKTILFLCTGNSARSIMAEAYMNAAGKDRWRAFSAGSHPTGRPNPLALQTLARHGIEPGAPRSKSWEEFAGENAPPLDVVVTVCDNAAGEACPVFPARSGAQVKKLHWSFPDPAAAEGDEAARRGAFEDVFRAIGARIDDFLARDSQ